MLQSQMVVNDCYILQSWHGEDVYTEHWLATAIFSATRFLLRFIKKNDTTDLFNTLRKEAVRCYHVAGPSISDFIEVDVYEGKLFISSEYHDEKPLSSLLKSKHTWQIDQICVFTITLAQALKNFHSQKIIYGSLNEESIISTVENNNLKIQKPSMLALLPLLAKGTPEHFRTYAYLAPEYKTSKELLEASDVYSLGVLFVRLVTGKLPFPDSTTDIACNSASLRFITNGLLRRGICEDLVKIVLRSLQPNPAQRYTCCQDMIDDIRYFMQKAQLEQPDDYRYDKNNAEYENNKNTVLYPLSPHSNLKLLNQLEKNELTPTKDEHNWSIEDYISKGKQALSHDKSTESFLTLAEAKEIQNVHIDPAFMKHLGLPQKKPKTSPAPQTEPTPILKNAQLPYQPPGIKNQMITSSITEDITVKWNYSRLRYQDMWNVVLYSVKRAKKGIGCFRYIQEPTLDSLSVTIFQQFESLKDSCLFVNLGSFERYGKADIATFLMMLRHGITRELHRESKRSIAYLARKVKKHDSFGAFASAPIGSMLYGKNSKEIDTNTLSTIECQKSIMRALFGFTRKSKPLVLVIRGGERTKKDLNDFLNMVSGGVIDVPLAIFVFFEHENFPSWHALSTIKKQ